MISSWSKALVDEELRCFGRDVLNLVRPNRLVEW